MSKKPSTLSETTMLIPPESEEPEAMIEGEDEGRLPDNSATVIFAVWSTLMGSTLLLMPKVFRSVGWLPASIGVVLVGTLSCYTGVCFDHLGNRFGRSNKEVLGRLLPKQFHGIALVSSLFICIGACMIYHVYVLDSIERLAGLQKTDTVRHVVAFGIFAVVWTMSLLRSLKPLFMASTWGIVVVLICGSFIILKSIHQYNHGTCHDEPEPPISFWAYTGRLATVLSTLTVSFFCHNLILQLLNQSTRPSKNPRNLGIAFTFTGLSYAVPSAFATVAFGACPTFDGDFVEMFDGPFSDVVRVAVSMLILVMYPIVTFVARTEFMDALHGPTGEVPYWQHVLFNTVYLGCAAVPAGILMPVTAVGAMVGVANMQWNLVIPAVMSMKAARKDHSDTPLWIAGQIGIIIIAIGLSVTTVLSVTGVMPEI